MKSEHTKRNTLILSILAILLTIFFPAVGQQLLDDTEPTEVYLEDSYVESEVVAEKNYRLAIVRGFRNEELLQEHYEKHGVEMGFDSAESYERAAMDVVSNPDALYKTEAEDGDGVYYVEATNEFVIVSSDYYVRTYFNPEDGLEYFNRQ